MWFTKLRSTGASSARGELRENFRPFSSNTGQVLHSCQGSLSNFFLFSSSLLCCCSELLLSLFWVLGTLGVGTLALQPLIPEYLLIPLPQRCSNSSFCCCHPGMGFAACCALKQISHVFVGWRFWTPFSYQTVQNTTSLQTGGFCSWGMTLPMWRLGVSAACGGIFWASTWGKDRVSWTGSVRDLFHRYLSL